MNRFVPLMQREWIQHRFGWALLASIPLLLALLLVGVGQIQLDEDTLVQAGTALPAMLGMVAIAGTTAVMFLIAWVSSLIIVSSLARRDHADRSIEFWLSLPAGHAESLAVPMFVHLIVVPAVALGVGLLGGYAISLVLVARLVGADAWFALPWLHIVPASLALALRLLAGLPLATLWLAPLILLVVLTTAWFRRWGWVVLTVGLGVGGWLLKTVFGQPLLSQVTAALLNNAATSLISVDPETKINGLLRGSDGPGQIPAWALHNFGIALHDLASPLLLGGLIVAAGCFALLVQWRQKGAGGAA
jgi:hypothetical protein